MLAQNGLRAEVQRNVKDFVPPFVLQVTQEPEIILQVLDHIENQNQLKVTVFDIANIAKSKAQSFVGPAFRQFHGLRGNVISPERRFAAQSLLKLRQDFPGSASHFANGRRRNAVSPQDAKNLPGLPRRLLDVPRRILELVLA